jgi:hypothetical protein
MPCWHITNRPQQRQDVDDHPIDRIEARSSWRRLADGTTAVAGGEGCSNRVITRQLHVTKKTVETHIASIFSKLDLIPERDGHRRVLAVRAWMSLQGEHAAGADAARR